MVKRIFKTNYIVFATFSSAQKSTLILEYILLKYRMTTWKWQFDILMLNGVSWLCIVVCLVAVHSSILINEVGCLGNRWHQVRAIYPLSLVSALLYFKREWCYIVKGEFYIHINWKSLWECKQIMVAHALCEWWRGLWFSSFDAWNSSSNYWNLSSYLSANTRNVANLMFFRPCIIVQTFLNYQLGPGSVVGIATAYGLDGLGIESRWGEILRTCPDRPLGPPSLLYNGYRLFPGGKVLPGRDADPSPSSSAEV